MRDQKASNAIVSLVAFYTEQMAALQETNDLAGREINRQDAAIAEQARQLDELREKLKQEKEAREKVETEMVDLRALLARAQNERNELARKAVDETQLTAPGPRKTRG